MQEIVLDIETQKEFAEVGRNNPHFLKVSVVGVFDYASNEFFTFEENQLSDLENLIRKADRVIGFNIKAFDWPVLQPYVSINLSQIPTLDIMEEVEKIVGFRISLNNIVQPTLKEGKSGNGLMALRLWREGKLDELKKYCLDDVRLTRDLYEYVKKNGKLFFNSRYTGIETINIQWPVLKKLQQTQTSLF